MTLLRRAKSDILFSNSVFIFLTRFFPVLATLLIQVYYSRYLPIEVYGTYQNFWVQLYIFAAIACVGVHVFIITYPPAFLIRLLYNAKLKYYLCLFLWIVIACATFACLQQDKGYDMLLAFSFLFVYVLSAIIEATLIVFMRISLLAYLNLGYALAFGYVHYCAITVSLDLNTLFLYVLVIMLVKFITYLLISFSYIKQNKQAALQTESDAGGVKSLWFHMGLYDFLNILSRWVDKFIISLILTEGASAVYFNGAVDIPFIPLIVGAAGSATLIQLAGKKDKSEPGFTLTLAHRSSRLLSAIVFPLFFFFILFSYELFNVFFTNKYEDAVPIFIASCFAIPLRAYSFTTVLQNRNKGGIINTGAVLDLVLAFAMAYPLYLWLGLPGIALSFTLATYVQATYYLYHTAGVLKVTFLELIPYRNWLAKLIIFASLFIGLHYFCSVSFSGKITLTLGFIVMTITILIGLWYELKQSEKLYGDPQIKE